MHIEIKYNQKMIINQLLDFVFPKSSLRGTEGTWLTDEEIHNLNPYPVRFHKALLRKRGIKHLDLVVAAGSYHQTPLLKKMILRFKYGRIEEMAPVLATIMTNAIPGLLTLKNPKTNNQITNQLVLCPVPLHWTRQLYRGFNQAHVLARHIAKETQLPCEQLLSRRKPTGHQAWRKKEKRLRALNNAFVYSHTMTIPKTVILIDDLFTTGATLDACGKALKNAGVKHVAALTVAHG